MTGLRPHPSRNPLDTNVALVADRPRRREAFTLVELLLAITLGGTVLALAARITVQVVRAESVIERLDHRQQARSRPFEILVDDLRRALAPELTLETRVGTQARPMLRFAALTTTSVNEQLAVSPSVISYHLVPTEEYPDRWHLVRSVRSLVEPEPPRESILACGLASLQIQIWRDGKWTLPTNSTLIRGRPQPISAVRIRWRWPEDELDRSRIVVFGEPADDGKQN